MGDIQILDVTLRDGGIVNDFRFGEQNIIKIVRALENAGARMIELGYLEKNTGTSRGRSQYCDEKVIEQFVLTSKKPGVTYLAMFDYGKFDAEALGERTEGGIDGIRFAFHKRNYRDALPLYNRIIQKGYETYMQPMVTLHYTEDELKELVDAANELDIRGLYFVDTFGQMHAPDIERLTAFFDERLRPDIALGFHAHNNIQLAYANAITFLQIPMERKKLLDSSVMGMGRGAGNLNTELIFSYLNRFYGGQYSIPPLLGVMDTVLETIRAQHPWGYSAAYYLSSVNDCSPIYANHYYSKHMLPIEHINELLGMLEGEKRISFDKKYAEELYRKFNGRDPYDDSSAVEKIASLVKDKTVCVLAPGRHLLDSPHKVQMSVRRADITISLNADLFGADYELITRADVLAKALAAGKKIIAPSSLTREQNENVLVVDYYKWITVDGYTYDSAGFIILKLLTELGAKEILLAGFDGFNVDLDLNYYDESLKKPVSREQIATINRAFSTFIHEEQMKTKIEFITESKYERPAPSPERASKQRLNLIFDCDGVLINSINVQKCAYYGSYREIVGDDKCPPFSEYLKHTGDSLPNIFRKMGLPVEMAGPYRRISSQAIDQIEINEELVALIREMRQYGVGCSICTGKDHDRMIAILKFFGIEELFDAVVCSDDVSEPKPSPVPVIKAIEEMGNGADVSNSVVIGDGYYDILSAKNAGCKVIQTMWYGDEGVPREADHLAETVGDLRSILMDLLGVKG